MSDRTALIPLVGALKETRVLTVGDVMLDRFVSGTVERISPEAPIPVLRVKEETAMLGGAGNVIRNLVALGASPRFITLIGSADHKGKEADGPGLEILNLFAELNLEDAPLIDSWRRTSTKTRFLADGQQMLRADREDTHPTNAKIKDTILGKALEALKDCAVLVLSDYGKGVLDDQALGTLIDAARQDGKPVVVDPKGTDYSRYRGTTVLTPNRKELMEATGLSAGTDDDVVTAARRLIEDCGIEAVLVTRSDEGMSVVTDDAAVHLEAETREVFDVSGAGDTVSATVAAALATGAGLEQAARLANVAAGVVVGKVGTAVAYADDVVAALHHQDISRAEAKVLALGPALDRLQAWRRDGQTISFTNGCFDLLHPGHVSLLAQAKAAAGRLVVGLNSDASVKRLKGNGRPVQSEAARAAVLASLETVDMVVLFEEDTPLNLIEAMRPEVLVKGADYAVENVVGADIVEGYGGSVLLAELVDGQSTSATIARMADDPD